MKERGNIELVAMLRSEFFVQRALVGVGLIASFVHFLDNALDIADYPEPSWITPAGVIITWLIISPIALVALSRKSRDFVFSSSAAIYSLILLSGVLHYFYASSMKIPLRIHLTVLSEAITGAALLITIIVGRIRGKGRELNSS